jgi:ABC-type multidrug transport system ATPase subunit
VITLKNFEVSHPSKYCFYLEQLDLEIGQPYLVVGPNGCGKSSFLKKLSFSDSKYAYVSFPSFGLLSFCSVIDNIFFFSNRLGLKDEARDWLIRELEKKNITLKNKVSTLSQGQAQFFKFLLVVNFPHELLCLDELLNYLDQDTYRDVLSILQNEASRKIIILSSTDFYADFSQVLLIENKMLTFSKRKNDV